MKKKILKIIAFILAISLCIGIALFANALVGNPVSKHLAKQAAEKHIEVNYPDRDFYISRVAYDFKGGDYNIFVESPSSPDSSFSLSADFVGKIRWDSYKDRVENKFNTAERIDKEYRQAVDNVLESQSFPYETHIAYGNIEFVEAVNLEQPYISDYALVMESLELDAFYDIGELGRKAGRLVVYVYDNDVSVKRLSEILLGIKDVMNKAGVEFKAIDCVLELPKDDDGYKDGYTGEERVEVENFLYEDIYEKDLQKRVEKANEKQRAYHAEQDLLKQQELEAQQ